MKLKKICLDMEYLLREKISQFLLLNGDDLMDDFNKLVFHIDMITKEIAISSDSPLYLKNIIQEDFYREFNPNFPGQEKSTTLI